MLRAGYKLLGKDKTCKRCDALIEWWKTNNGKVIPFDPLPISDESTATPHWSTCGKSQPPQPQSQNRREMDVQVLRDSGNARAVFAVYDDAVVLSCREGLLHSDLHKELFTIASRLREGEERYASI